MKLKLTERIGFRIVNTTLVLILILLIIISAITNLLLNDVLQHQTESVANGAYEAVQKRVSAQTLETLITENDMDSGLYQTMRNNLITIYDATDAQYLHIVMKKDSGYQYLIDGVTNPDETIDFNEPVESEYNEFYSEVFNTKKPHYGDFELYQGQYLFSNYFPIFDGQNNVIAFLGVDFDVTEAVNNVNSTFNKILLISLISLLIIGTVLALLINRALKPIQTLAKDCETMANYDLTHEIYDHYKGEFKILATALRTLKNNNLKLISNIQHISESVTVNFKTVHDSTHSISGMIQETTASLSETAENIEEQVQEMDKLAFTGTKLTTTVTDMHSAISESTKETERVNSNTKESTLQMNQMKEQFADTAKGFDELNHKMSDLYEKSGLILGIIETISGIASQTNLLALNASIEAARAGEQGRGFAVVAEEIRKLAEESATSVSKIDNIVKNVLQEIKASNDITSVNYKLITASNQQIETTINTYATTENSITSIIRTIESLKGKIENISQIQTDVHKGTVKVTELSHTNASYIEIINASSQEESANVEEITSSIDTLSHMIDELSVLVKQYKI